MLATDTLLYNAKERVYYKEVYSEWTQPIFNANNFNDVSGNYVLTASHQATPAWYAFNASDAADNCWWTKHGTPSETNFCWICFYSTKKMKFSSIKIKNETSSPVNFQTGVLQGSQDGQTWVDLCALTGQNTTALEMTFDFENDTGYYYYRCYFTAAFGVGVAIQWIKFYGTQHTDTMVSTATDYDYYEDVPVIKAPETTKTINTFWKIKYKTWNYARPKLSNNTGNAELKVSASSQYNGDYAPYKSFASTSGAVPWISKDGATTAWYRMEFPRPFKITSVFMRNRSSKYDNGAAIRFVFQASNDGTTWEDVTPTITNNVRGQGATWTFYTQALKGYKFYRFNLTKVGGAYISIGFPTFYGEEEYVDNGSPVDYSYIETVTETQKGAVTEPRLAYFKRGTEPNLRLRGTPNIVDGVFSSITAATASILPRNSYHPGTQEWEWGFKVTTGSDIVNQHLILQAAKGFAESTRFGTRLYVQNNYFVFCVSYNGTAWDYLYESAPAAVSAFPIQTNTTYWLKFHHKDGVYTLYVSTDGETYQLYHQKGLSTYMYNNNTAWVVGAYNNGSYTALWNGSIDLKEAYIKFGDEIVWRGTHPVECSEEEAEWSEWVNINKPIN
jgi:hypothetical protein